MREHTPARSRHRQRRHRRRRRGQHHDGVTNAQEDDQGTDPIDADTSDDGVGDASEDEDNDGVLNGDDESDDDGDADEGEVEIENCQQGADEDRDAEHVGQDD